MHKDSPGGSLLPGAGVILFGGRIVSEVSLLTLTGPDRVSWCSDHRGVSLAITGASHSRLQGRPSCDFRKLRFPEKLRFSIFRMFFHKHFQKIRKSDFLDSRDQNQILKILKYFHFLYMTSISYINHHFRAPSPPKPLKSRPQGQNLPGFLLIAHSDHRGPVSAQFCRLS